MDWPGPTVERGRRRRRSAGRAGQRDRQWWSEGTELSIIYLRRSSLPEGVRGSAATKLERLGHLERGQPLAQNARSWASAAGVAGSQHHARRDRLAPLRGRPALDGASATAGWASSTASTSVGATFSPPVTIVSACGPVTVRRPSPSSAPRSPVRSTGPRLRRDGRRPHDDLAVVDPDARAEQRGPASRRRRARGRHLRAGLGQPVGLGDGHAGGARALQQRGRARAAADQRAAQRGRPRAGRRRAAAQASSGRPRRASRRASIAASARSVSQRSCTSPPCA